MILILKQLKDTIIYVDVMVYNICPYAMLYLINIYFKNYQ